MYEFLADLHGYFLWRRGVVFITNSQFHSTKSAVRCCVDSNPARLMPKFCNGEGNCGQATFIPLIQNSTLPV